MTEKRGQAEDYRYFALGAVSAFLYGTTLFAPFLAAPLQASWTRGGFRAFLLSIAVALAGIAGWLLWQFRGMVRMGIGEYLLILSLPMGLAASVAVINSRFISSWDRVYRTLAGGCLVAVVAVPSVLSLYNDPEIVSYLRTALESMTESLGSANAESFQGAVLRSSLDAESMLDDTRRTVTNSYAAVIVLFTFLGHWIGTRMAGRDAPGARELPRIEGFKVPSALIWPFLVTWFAVLALRLPQARSLTGTALYDAIAWNAALTVSFYFAVQGYGILRHFLGRFAPAGPLRFAGILLVVLLLLNVTTSAWAAGALTVLGATETWIPYRASKGVQT